MASPTRLPIVALGVVIAALTVLFAPASCWAQILRGVVVEAESRTPLTGVLVTLIDDARRDRQRFLVGADGLFRFDLPRPGRYSLRAERMGTASRTLDGFDVGPSDTVIVRISLTIEAVALEGIDVSVERRCELADDGGAEIQRVWEEARKALNAASLTDSVGTYRYEVRRHVRELDERTLRIRWETASAESVVNQRPIASHPASELMDRGFVVRDRGGYVFMAPDADVLLSEAFLESHCFTLRPGQGEQRDMVGLEFRPHTDRRRYTDIAGVLWISARDGALDFLEYHYINLPDLAPRFATDQLGGRIQFHGMPDGSWIVSDWYIRMPKVEDEGFGRRLVGIFEEGGRVERALRAGSDSLAYAARTGSVAGQVELDGRSGDTGSVIVLGLGAQARVDAEGRFLLENIPVGRYELAFARAALMGLDRWLPVGQVLVEEGARAFVALTPLASKTVLARACGMTAAEWDPDEVVLLGEVLDPESGIALADVDVEAAWEQVRIWDSRPGSFSATATEVTRGSTTDGTGSFMLCGVPSGRSLTVQTHLGTATAQEVTVSIPDGQPIGYVVIPMGSVRAGHEQQRGQLAVDRDSTFGSGLGRVGNVRIHGVVRARETGHPLPAAGVHLIGVGTHLTDNNGRFTIEDLPPGRYPIEIEYLGRKTVADTLVLGSAEAVNVEIRLDEDPIRLEGIEVVVEPRSLGLESAGFYDRRDRWRSQGTYITRTDIEENGSMRPTDLLGMVPGSHIEFTTDGMIMVMHRQGNSFAFAQGAPRCEPTVYVDGLVYHDPNDDGTRNVRNLDFLSTAVIEGIEVYVGTSTPLQFRPDGCGAVVFWTRGYR